MTYEELYDVYLKRAETWLKRNSDAHEKYSSKFKNIYKDVSPHVKDIIVKLIMVRTGFLRKGQCGSFIQSFLDNDLRAALSNADEDVYNNLRVINMSYYNIEYHDLPKTIDQPVFEESTQDE